jgi:hypothetical protein
MRITDRVSIVNRSVADRATGGRPLSDRSEPDGLGAVGDGFDQVGGGDDGRSVNEVVGGDAAWSRAGAACPDPASVGDEAARIFPVAGAWRR